MLAPLHMSIMPSTEGQAIRYGEAAILQATRLSPARQQRPLGVASPVVRAGVRSTRGVSLVQRVAEGSARQLRPSNRP
jgi:hypothetical protein